MDYALSITTIMEIKLLNRMNLQYPCLKSALSPQTGST